MNYPFSTGDLLCAGQTASSYLDNNTKVRSNTAKALHMPPTWRAWPSCVQLSAAASAACLRSATPDADTAAAAQVPWEDLRYLFGEILYGGHIVEDWDRRLSSAYLNKHFTEALLEGPELFPGFTPAPSNANHKMVRHSAWCPGSGHLSHSMHTCRCPATAALQCLPCCRGPSHPIPLPALCQWTSTLSAS